MLENIRGFLVERGEWERVSRPALASWLAFYAVFLLHALADDDKFLLIDNVNLIVHEAGHLLFGWLGASASLYGGTLLQFFVPLALAAYFWWHRKTAAVAWALFFVFENCLYTAVYIADARAQVLPLVTVGDPDYGGHDWFQILARWRLLRYDTTIAALVRGLGWLGMLAAPAWLVFRHRRQAAGS